MLKFEPDYPLQGTQFDKPLNEVLSLTEIERSKFINKFLNALAKKIVSNEMSLKKRISMQTEMRDLRKLVRSPYDKFLLTEEKTRKRNVLGVGSGSAVYTINSSGNYDNIGKVGYVNEQNQLLEYPT